LTPKVNTHNNFQLRIGRKDNIIDQATTELRLSIEMIKEKLNCIDNTHITKQFTFVGISMPPLIQSVKRLLLQMNIAKRFVPRRNRRHTVWILPSLIA
jgi:hypothetical protein